MKNRHTIKATCYDRRGHILSVGYNNYNKSHPVQAYFAEKVGHQHRIFLHAEIAAILKARDKKIFKIVIERYNREGKPLLAAPCPVCQEAIKAFGIHFVEYTVGV